MFWTVRTSSCGPPSRIASLNLFCWARVSTAVAVGVRRDGHERVARERDLRGGAVGVEVRQDRRVAALAVDAGTELAVSCRPGCQCRPAASFGCRRGRRPADSSSG